MENASRRALFVPSLVLTAIAGVIIGVMLGRAAPQPGPDFSDEDADWLVLVYHANGDIMTHYDLKQKRLVAASDGSGFSYQRGAGHWVYVGGNTVCVKNPTETEREFYLSTKSRKSDARALK